MSLCPWIPFTYSSAPSPTPTKTSQNDKSPAWKTQTGDLTQSEQVRPYQKPARVFQRMR